MDVLETYADKSLGRKSLNNSSAISLRLVITSWRQPCCYATCLNPQTPWRDAFGTRCKVCSTWRLLSKLRARPLDNEGRPQKNAPSQLETRERRQSIKSHPLEAREQCRFKNTSSTIESLVMLAMTSTSIDTASMGMLRNEATAPTTVDATTMMRTGWHQSRWAL